MSFMLFSKSLLQVVTGALKKPGVIVPASLLTQFALTIWFVPTAASTVSPPPPAPSPLKKT